MLKNDPYWRIRSFFSEAAHFSSVSLFHINDEDRACALYLIGVKLLNEFMRGWYMYEEVTEERIFGKLFNVNTPQDYERARKIFEI